MMEIFCFCKKLYFVKFAAKWRQAFNLRFRKAFYNFPFIDTIILL